MTFYIYYSENKHGPNKIPSLAISMEEGHIAEILSVDYKQEVDPYISDILDSKLNSFGEEA